MSWDDIVQLVSEIPGINQTPLVITEFDLIASQLSLSLYDPETEKVNFETNEWLELENLLLTLKMQNTQEVKTSMSSFGVGNTAVVIGSVFGNPAESKGIQSQESSLRLFNVEWDVVSFPLFNGNLPAKQMLVIGIPRNSENKDDAIKVLRYLLSNEVQNYNNGRGLASLRADANSMVEEFGDKSELLSGRSTTSFFTAAPKGSLDTSFEYYGMDLALANISWSDDSMFDLDTSIQRRRDHIVDEIMTYFNKRNRFVEEMRSRFDN